MMSSMRHVAVIDIGKTNAKVALVDLATLSQIAVRQTANEIAHDGLYPHDDVDGLWSFVLDSLAALAREAPVDAISVTTHGAAAALVDAEGRLALPVLDYEHDGPAALASEYDTVRPPFSQTGSPRLPAGLNLGAQIFWQERAFSEAFDRVAAILPYPQYWAFRLSGEPACEVTSLGAHTDLWNPFRRDWSELVKRLDWKRLMPPMRKASDRIGHLKEALARRVGLRVDCAVLGGIHDSNASLLTHLMMRKPPFTVVSTGTWVISLAVGGNAVDLDEHRDTLANVNAFGDPVPSARFMGGREFALMRGDREATSTMADLARVVDADIMLLPTVQPGAGPFPNRRHNWVGDPDQLTPGERNAAISSYLGLMTSTCLSLIGADGPIILEGPFAENAIFRAILGFATSRDVITGNISSTGTSLGAALLANPSRAASYPAASAIPDGFTLMPKGLASYLSRWSERTGRPSQA